MCRNDARGNPQPLDNRSPQESRTTPSLSVTPEDAVVSAAGSSAGLINVPDAWSARVQIAWNRRHNA